MPNLSEFGTYKHTMINLLVNDAELVKLLTNTSATPTLPAATLLNTQIFPYDYVDETTDDSLCFVCMEVIEGGVSNCAVCDLNVYVYIFVPKDLMNMTGKTRRDAIAGRIDCLLNGNTTFGFGKLERRPGSLITLNAKYRGRSLRYVVQDWNRTAARF